MNITLPAILTAIGKYNLIVNTNRTFIVGIRRNLHLDCSRQTYDDSIIVCSPDSKLHTFTGSTDPGVNKTFILKAGQKIEYGKGFHRGNPKHPALKPEAHQSFWYYNLKIGLERPVLGWKACNIHAGGKSLYVGKNSQMCQVIFGGIDGQQYKDFLKLTYYNSQLFINYFLIKQEDL